MTHDELVKRAVRWLRNSVGCAFVLSELRTLTREEPDAIGWKCERTILVECKTSRADFFADQKKPFRIHSEMGMGAHRFYICPDGLIQTEELPDGWGLLWVRGRRVKQLAGQNVGPGQHSKPAFPKRNEHAECLLMQSALRRLQQKGLLQHIYDK